MTFAEKLGLMMTEHELSAPMLADFVGVETNTVRVWLRGGTMPGRRGMERLSSVFRCDKKTILAGVDYDPAAHKPGPKPGKRKGGWKKGDARQKGTSAFVV